METKNDLTGQLARLPDGQLVKIETVYDDGQAMLIRVAGEFKGKIALCSIARLLSADADEPLASEAQT